MQSKDISLTPARAREVDTWVREVIAQTQVRRRAAAQCGVRAPRIPPRWRLTPPATEPIDVTPDQRYGPLHSLVVARCEQVLSADAATLANLVRGWVSAAAAGRASHPLVDELKWHARRIGRAEAAIAVHEDAVSASLTVLGRSRPSRRWQDACRVVSGEAVGTGSGGVAMAMSRQDRLLMQAAYGQWFAGGLLALMLTDTLADSLPDRLLIWGQGPWAWALSDGVTPGVQWIAPARVVTGVRRVLSDLTADDVAEVGNRYLEALHDDHFLDICQILDGHRITGAGALPKGVCLLAPAVIDQLDGESLYWAEQATHLLVAAFAFRDDLGPEVWNQATAPLQPVIPGLWVGGSAA